MYLMRTVSTDLYWIYNIGTDMVSMIDGAWWQWYNKV